MLKLFINNIFSNQPDKQPETLIKTILVIMPINDKKSSKRGI